MEQQGSAPLHDMAQPDSGASESGAEPSLVEIARALEARTRSNGAVRPGVAAQIAAERGWHGRFMDILAVLTEDAERMGYLAGGRKPDEIVTWLAQWADSPFSLSEIRDIVGCGGWDPEPFVPVVQAGLLERLVHRPDGTLRRVNGELAGGWLSDQFALAQDDEEILLGVRRILDDETQRDEGRAG